MLHDLNVHKIELELQNEELRRAQAELEAERARYFDLYDLAPVGYCTLSEEGLILEANLTVATLLGAARGALIKQPISRFVLKEDQDIYCLLRKQLFETGEPRACDLRLLRTDGTTFWAHLEATAALGVDGAPVCRVSLSDITERAAVEAGLEKTRKELVVIKQSADAALEFAEAVINTVREPLISLDQDLRVVTVNRSFYDFFKVKPEDTVGQLIYDLGNKQWDIPKLRELLETILPKGTSMDGYRVEHEFASIGPRTMLLNARQIEQASERARLILVAIEDITERTQAQEAARESEESRQDLFDTMTSGCAIYEVRGDGSSGSDYVVKDFNASSLSMEGKTKEEVVGKSLLELRPAIDEFGLVPVLQKVWQTGEPAYFPSYRYVDENFANWYESRVFKLPGGEVAVLYDDVTERKRAEEVLRQTEEQLSQSQKMEAMGQLAGGIAHDFNNLLAVILGYSEMTLTSGASSVDEVRPDVEQIKAAAERAAALTKQILAFSRRQALRPTVVSFNEVLAGMEPLLRRTLGENIDLASFQDPDLGYVEADVHQFEQVLMNLAINARDAMVSGGRLTLETANVELGEEYCHTHPEVTPGSYVMLSVSDTGVGMEEVTCARVFEPFFTTKAMGQGTGLGLATVHGIVLQSHGSISVYSEPGEGTSFKVYLPLAAQASFPAEIVIPPYESARGSETVMVVEDEAALRGLIERVLGGAGYTTFAFGSAVEALEALERGDCSVDLLLTDVMLSGALQGDDLARAVLATRPDLPVLFMSGYPRNSIVHAGRLDEGVNFVEKPFSQQVLATMVRTVLDQPQTSG
jgi:two-component system cell cycle sensor histidine kinase/response regulator CckA